MFDSSKDVGTERCEPLLEDLDVVVKIDLFDDVCEIDELILSSPYGDNAN